MQHIQYVLSVLGAIFIYIIITGIYMRVATRVGEAFGVGKFFRVLWKKITRSE